MAKISRNKASKAKPVYSDKKNYEWKPEDEFVLDGIEFSTVYNTLKEAALSPAGTSAFNIAAAYQAMQSIFVEGVEGGFITETVVPTQSDKTGKGPLSISDAEEVTP